MSDDPFETDDAAYVLGALSPDERHAFEQHLRVCDRCAESVQELAGLPGLLARAEIGDDESVADPPDLLTGLLETVGREQRRQRWINSGGWLAAAACIVALVLTIVLRPAAAAPTAAAPAGTPMTPIVAGAPLAAQVSLTGVTWGTKIVLKCTYPATYGGASGSYVLVVVDKNHNYQRVGSWKVIAGGSSTMNASTDVADSQIQRVEVQNSAGQPVLFLDL